MSQEMYIATNNGNIGGGEVMLLNIARAARSLGVKVTIIGPSEPSQLVEAAADEGFARVVLPARNRSQYMVALRTWHTSHRDKLLWCNGLVPAVATGGRKNRIVQLHQLPSGVNARLLPLARRKAETTLVPSRFMANRIPGTRVFSNWVPEVATDLKHDRAEVIRVGFIGRLAPIKGIITLCEAVKELNRYGSSYRLVVAGEPVFTSPEDKERVERALAGISEHTDRLGWITPEQLFKNIDVLAVPSVWSEPFGLVAIEAMSARMPLIISDSGALPEVVGDNYPYTVPAANAGALADMITRLGAQTRDNSAELAETVSNAFWRWQENYSPEAGKERLRELLQRQLQQ